MFRQMWIAALVAITALSSLAIATAQESGKKQVTNSIGMKLTLIPAGEFKMGSGESAEATAAFFNKMYGGHFPKVRYFKNEHPQHRVRITKPFYLGTYHVTRGQFRQFVKDTGYKTGAEKARSRGLAVGTRTRRRSSSTTSIPGGMPGSSRPTRTRW